MYDYIIYICSNRYGSTIAKNTLNTIPIKRREVQIQILLFLSNPSNFHIAISGNFTPVKARPVLL